MYVKLVFIIGIIGLSVEVVFFRKSYFFFKFKLN